MAQVYNIAGLTTTTKTLFMYTFNLILYTIHSKVPPKGFLQTFLTIHISHFITAIIPPEGYPNQKNYSIKAVRWIQSKAKERGIEIKHAMNGGEQRISGHWMATMKNLEPYLNSMDVTGMNVLLISQTETEFNIISV